MPRHGFSSAEKAQCVLCISQGNGLTAVRRMFRSRYDKDPPARSTIWEWNNNYRTRDTHACDKKAVLKLGMQR